MKQSFRKLLVATHNRGKVREYRQLLTDLPLHVTYLDEEGIDLDVEETGATFEANARLKAEAYAAATGLPVLADDSGLLVDALDGAPGVHSARFGGPGLSDGQRCDLLLQSLADHREPAQRTARFRCVLVAAATDGRTCQSAGVCEGHIALAPVGSGGFGYDPIFCLTELARTMSELKGPEKDRLSHRGRALQAIRPLLMDTFPELRG